jgi:hypothetical protein
MTNGDEAAVVPVAASNCGSFEGTSIPMMRIPTT